MEEKTTASRTAVWAAMSGIYLIWGSTYLAVQVTVPSVPPFLMNGARNLLSGCILFVTLRAAGARRPSAGCVKRAMGTGLLLMTGGSGLVVWSQKMVPSGVAALMVGSVPLWLALLDYLCGAGARRHQPAPAAALGILFGFGGIALLVGPAKLTGIRGDIDPAGALALVFGALFWALGSIRSRNSAVGGSSLMNAALHMVWGGVGLAITGILIGEPAGFDPRRVTGAALAGFVYLTVFGSLVGFTLYSWLLESAPTTLVSTYAYVNPVVAIILGVLFLDENLSPRVLVSAGLILLSVLVVTMSGRGRAKRQVTP